MRIKRFRWIGLLSVIALSLYGVWQTRATCNPGDTGTAGNDTIVCDVNNPPAQGSVEGGDGDDNIVIEEGVSTSALIVGDSTSGVEGTGDDVIIVNGDLSDSFVVGDSPYDGGSGDDVIVNNSTGGVEIFGDSSSGNGSGNDLIINNGITYGLYGDSGFGDGSGSDTITNNGETSIIAGDSYNGSGSGNDTITNNGTVTGDIYGDATGNFMGSDASGASSVTPGSDTITNAGYVTGTIYGDNGDSDGAGNDLIINSGAVDYDIVAGGGDDTVVITGAGVVGGTINGGTGYDVLTFDFSSSNPQDLIDLAAQISAANPAGGSITFNGHTYVWQNFEELSQLLLSIVRLNDYGDPFAVFCTTTGLDVYFTRESDGVFGLGVTGQAISNGLDSAQASGTFVRIASSANVTLYALAGGELQVNATNGAEFRFIYEDYCGILPLGQEIIEEEVEPDTFVIVNRPR